MTRVTWYYAIIGERRAGQAVEEKVLSLHRIFDKAVLVRHEIGRIFSGWRLVIRGRGFTDEEISTIVRQWGEEDGVAGVTRAHVDRLPEPWHAEYLAGVASGRRKVG